MQLKPFRDLHCIDDFTKSWDDGTEIDIYLLNF